MQIKDSLSEGAKELENIDIDFDNSFVKIFLDYMHINHFKPGQKYSMHAHPNYEFHYIADGLGEIGLLDLDQIFKNESIVNKSGYSKSKNVSHLVEYYLKYTVEKEIESKCKVFKVSKGDLFVNQPGHFHWQVSSKEEPIVEYAMRCSFDLNLENNDDPLIDDYKMIYNLLLKTKFGVVRDEFSVRNSFEKIFEETYYRMPGYIVKTKHMLLQLIINFSRNYWDKKEVGYEAPKRDMKKRNMQLIDEYIEANMQKYISIDELANNIFVSSRSLSRFVKSETGKSVQKYVLEKRLNKAVDLIRNTNFKLLEISELTGFSSQFHLSKIVKQMLGKSPIDLR